MAKNLRRITTISQMFKYYNNNPMKQKLPDCVCRAISLALRLPYNYIMDKLRENGVCYDCDDLTVDCYTNLIRDLGYESSDAGNLSVEELCSAYPDDILIIRISGHLTCAINGILHDIWDCSNEIADLYWIIT